MLGISVDSAPVQEAFAMSLGKIPYPVLADFEPKGAVTKAYGVYNEENGIPRRSVVIVDKAGIVRQKYFYGPGVLPEPAEILAEVKAL